MTYFDTKNNRLVSVKSAATADFWDAHWSSMDIKKRVCAGSENGMIKLFTKKFLAPPARVVDAGCGIGQNVYGLKSWGYDAWGVDYAETTVTKTKEHFPELQIISGDVRKLPFKNDFFDGYWSLGVIEHFKEGYGDIIAEARRVIKPGGYLLVSIPWFSPLRRWKARHGKYPIFSESVDMQDFYEFLLDDRRVTDFIVASGFHLVYQKPFDAVKGIKDEIAILAPILQRLYDSRSFVAKIIRFVVTTLFARWAGHVMVLVFKRI